jgi:hypothetical protein
VLTNLIQFLLRGESGDCRLDLSHVCHGFSFLSSCQRSWASRPLHLYFTTDRKACQIATSLESVIWTIFTGFPQAKLLIPGSGKFIFEEGLDQ